MLVMQESILTLCEQVFNTMKPLLNELQRRQLAAAMARALGHGGQKEIKEITGIGVHSLRAGVKGLETGQALELSKQGRIRRQGGGRKALQEKYSNLEDCIEQILKNDIYGDPKKVIVWTNLSLEKISKLLKEKYHIEAGKDVVSRILDKLGYSKQTNQKMKQVGKQHKDRNAQFLFINETAQEFIDAGDPVISVDTKKKELIGDFKNAGQEYRPKENPRKVLDHDFPIKGQGKVAPYGIYLVNNNEGFVNLGRDHDTSEFAVESIRKWWNIVGKHTFPKARRIYINCDGGGSTGSRIRMWKTELAQFALETGLEIHVSHLPPGTSKWNKVEHRLFCYISKNWQGKPLF